MSDQIETRVSDLYSRDPGVRDATVARLIAIGKPAVAPLVRLLVEADQQMELSWYRDPYPGNLRRDELPAIISIAVEAAERALAGIGTPAIAPLLTLLYSKKAIVRERAARALSRIGKPAIGPLIQALRSDDTGVSVTFATALTGIADKQVEDALPETLTSAKSVEVRAATAAALAGNQDTQTITSLREALRNAVKESRRERWGSIYIRSGVLLVILAFIVLDYHSGKKDWMIYCAQLFQVIVLGAFVDKTAKLRRNALSALSKAANPQMAGAFAAYLQDKDVSIRKLAADTLKELLPQLHASDKRYITPGEMDLLINALGGKDDRFTIVILKALEQIGDERALPRVEALAASSPLIEGPQVRQAARDCLPLLRQRVEEAQQAQTLLRASQAVFVTTPDALLRPAVAAEVDVAVEQLLRPQS